ncbi:MAG TPA: UDP-N-acetylmuramoyl-L-alanyl-D-glutamate--2,6-diaminopimelate ligase [Candidatus Hydrogenedentes bacterium]|nr:UDP-N-acetylmuramoyl-L-alanyl-D-glutamate--2,6-diaminopimelate ligase [Candidatus Hydrogenedentota bacterium]
MNRSQLSEAAGIPFGEGPDFEATGVTEDSRRVRPGFVFAALPGVHADGHDYAARAVEAGAVAVLGGRGGLRELHGVPYLGAPAPRRATALLAQAFAGSPTRRQCVLGVTGTNGKTSTAHLVRAVLSRAGRPCANFGTIAYHIGGEALNAPHTTPFPEDLAAMFARALAAGDRHVVMEASSHALDQERVAGVSFTAAAFTNLTQDHLDYHGDMDRYRAAKGRLFSAVTPDPAAEWPRFTVVNEEDPAAPYFRGLSAVPCHGYGAGGDVRAEGVRMLFSGTAFRLVSPWGAADLSIRLAGMHNVSNALCAAALCLGLGLDVAEVAAGLESLDKVDGRFEAVNAGQPFHVIVDYAHTDDGLANVLRAARALCEKRVITVFGCGGDRDRGKRPKMGAVAAQMSDFCVLTSDNPRTEDPHRILLDVEVGLQRAGKAKGDDYLVIESREEAIHTAVSMARPGDLVMIAGKGHENYQIIGTERRHFDDRECALAALKALGHG